MIKSKNEPLILPGYKKTCLFCCLILLSLPLVSQVKKKYKYELLGGIGPSGFLGDIGGSKRSGTHFIDDYNFLSTRYCINAGMRYKPEPKLAVKVMLNFAMVSGNDSLSDNLYRRNRNINFRSPIIELSVQGEYYLNSDINAKTLYSLVGLKTKKKRKRWAVYVFGGIGLFYYNPQEKLNVDENWYSVRKYHVEGQGLPGGSKQFSNYSIAIPIGLGYRQVLDKKWSIGVEFGFRKTFTDYIDGVSGNYYNSVKLTQAYGTTAASLADPNLGKIDGATNTGQERGNSKYKDSYMFFTVNVGYMLKGKQHRTRAKF